FVWLWGGGGAPRKIPGLGVATRGFWATQHGCRSHLLTGGDAPLRATLEHVCGRDVPGSVYFPGHIRSREALADTYANCDLLLHPNPREPFGIAPLEAMASGLPVIAPASGGITSYACAGNASLVEPDAEAFAGAAIALREHPELADAHRRAGRATAKRFDWPAVTASFFALYDELHAIVQGRSAVPATPPAFYSTCATVRRPFECQC